MNYFTGPEAALPEFLHMCLLSLPPPLREGQWADTWAVSKQERMGIFLGLWN